jgi:hypothetical protein
MIRSFTQRSAINVMSKDSFTEHQCHSVRIINDWWNGKECSSYIYPLPWRDRGKRRKTSITTISLQVEKRTCDIPHVKRECKLLRHYIQGHSTSLLIPFHHSTHKTNMYFFSDLNMENKNTVNFFNVKAYCTVFT